MPNPLSPAGPLPRVKRRRRCPRLYITLFVSSSILSFNSIFLNFNHDQRYVKCVQYLGIFLILIYFPETKTSAILHRDTRFVPKKAIGGKGCYIFLEDGTKFLDSTGGAAVSCLGHGNEQVTQIIKDQMDQISYCHSAFFGTQVAEDLAKLLVDSTGGKLSKVFITSSGESRQSFNRKFSSRIQC